MVAAFQDLCHLLPYMCIRISMEQLSVFFKALADPTRLRIMNLLLRSPFCVCEMERILKLSQPLLSRHLAYLRSCGLVESQREGMRVNYNLNEKHLFLKQVRPLLLDALGHEAAGRGDLQMLNTTVWKRRIQRNSQHEHDVVPAAL